ncbi:MAG: sel1 repeat family protein [Alphaproteobacteria bacterium]|nr:MAG: sel1 repeat family protein [Alphaproteobacteria bacterium]
MEQQTPRVADPLTQLKTAWKFLMHNHYAQIAVLVIIVLWVLFTLMKRASMRKVRELEARAKGGDAVAAAELGELYEYGEEGAPVNYRQAERWYRAAASVGNAAGQNGLGSLYFNGHGMLPNYSDAFKYYELAAKQGHPLGQANLALLHHRGKGTSPHPQKAYFWALLAKTNPKSVEIQKRTASFGTFFNEVYNNCPPAQREAPEERARTWKPEKKGG